MNEHELLLEAAKNDDLNQLQELLSRGIDPNTWVEDWTPLLKASFKGNATAVKLLLNARAMIDTADENGWTPLYVAAQNGCVDVVAELLSSNADVDKCAHSGWTPLFAASYYGHYTIVSMLIAANAQVNKAENGGRTPLWAAASNGRTIIASQLICANANVNQSMQHGYTPLYIAAQNGHSVVVTLLIKANADINLCQEGEATPLFIAAQNGHAAVVKLLLEAKADVEKSVDDGATPLFVAAQNGHFQIVALLLQHNANINAPKSDGATPLYIACQLGHVNVVKLLLQADANVNACEIKGETPLWVSSEMGHEKIVALLINANASVDQADNTGATPLFIAARKDHDTIVSLLLKANADFELRNKINALYRHGTRYPMASEYSKMLHVLEEMQSTYFEDIPQWLQTYSFNYDKNMTEILAPQGIEELEGLGLRAKALATKYGFPMEFSHDSYIMEHTRIHRTKESAMAFAKMYFDDVKDVEYLVKKAGQDIDLRFFDNCPTYASKVDKNNTALTVETKKFEESKRGYDIVTQVHKALNLPTSANLTFAQVKSMYDACAYEVALFNRYDTWCTLFTRRDLYLLDFHADLKKFYQCGTGYDISYKIAGPLLKHIMETMEDYQHGNSTIRGYFRFAHAETILPLFCVLGLCPDSKLRASLSYDELKQRTYKVSNISPFAANLMFHLYECPTTPEYRIQLLVNEDPLPLSYCREKVFCTMQELEIAYDEAMKYDFQKQCQLNQ
ncbi:ankyrin 2,3/unc44 [Thraustotheca clavata]|uniref:Ankyrin 2,3/unc44 n=1 Tax=Thraustotheca clavata TaxID=74557 RepID=A0A1W0A2X4_9STRA|nr:ankyrin 2,3/unc44 [Thraustotheca clavata]